MPRITRDLAARLARKLAADDTWDDAREVCDSATSRELHAVQLDLLTVWAIEARLAASTLAPERRSRLRDLIRMKATVAEIGAVFGTVAAERTQAAV